MRLASPNHGSYNAGMMKKHRILLLSSVLFSVVALGACSPEPVSIEEKVLMESFSGLSAAQAYDHLCQKDSLQRLPQTDPKMANLMGNTQMLAYRISGFMRERRPDDTVDDAVKRLQDTQKLFAAKAEAALKNDGCDSPAGKAGLNSFTLYTSNQPGVVHQLVDQEVIKRGGKPVLQKIDQAAPASAPQGDNKGADKGAGKAEDEPTQDQLDAAEAAAGAAPPVDAPRATPAWGEWVRNQFRPSAALKKEE